MATRKTLTLIEQTRPLREMLAELDALNEKINAERATLKHAAIHEIRVDMLAYGITVLDIAKSMGVKRWKVKR